MRDKKRRKKKMAAEVVKPWWREAADTIIWAFVLAMIIRTFIVQAFWIPSGSMEHTLEIGDRVLVAKFWKWFFKPSRGSINVFIFPGDRNKDYVKRLIAVPGDVVDIKKGVVFINGQPIQEPYVNPDNPDYSDLDTSNLYPSSIFPFTKPPFTVPEGKYFMLGDNRHNSADSRFWGFVPIENIIGPVFFRYWPLNRIGIPK